MAIDVSTTRDCPDGDALRDLIRGRLSDAEQIVLTNHLDECPDCQAKLEELAADGDLRLSDAFRHVQSAIPPRNSAFWRALQAAEVSVTQSLSLADTTRTDEFKLDFLSPSDTPEFIGRIAHFEIRRLIGRGGMGAVFQALDPSLHREVAIKILDPQLANNELARQRFCREARAAASVSHDNLVSVFQVDEDEGNHLPFLVMQLVTGETLEQRLKRLGRLSVAATVQIGMQAAAGLAAAHANGLIHRDIKPANILLEAGTDKVKLTDFGLARAAEDLKLTRSGFVAGTPLYMAPEQARGEEVDSRADLFSLGAVLYEALAGVPPFEGKTPLAVLRRIADDEHIPIEQLNPEVPDWLADVIDRLLAKYPADRFQSAAELAELLSTKYSCLQPTEVIPEPCKLGLSASKIMGRRRSRRLLAATLFAGPFLLGAATGGLGVWFLTPQPTVEVVRDGFATIGNPARRNGPAPLAILKGSGGAVWSVTATADGHRIVLGLENGELPLFEKQADGQSWKLLYTLGRHAGTVWSVDFSADGKQLVSASDDGSVKVWNVDSAAALKTLPHPSSVRAAAISPVTGYIVTGSRDGLVRVFDPDDEIPMRPIRQFNHGAAVNAVAFAPDGMAVASAGSDHRVVIWEVVPSGRQRIALSRHKGPVYTLSFSPDGEWLASAGWDQSVILSDLKDGSIAREMLNAHEEGIGSIDFACCGKVIATAGHDGLIKLWDAETGNELATFAGHKGMAHVVRFTPNASALITGGRDGTALIWPSHRPEK